MGVLRKRGQVWYIDYTDQGGRRIVRAVGPNRREAEAVLRLREGEVVAGRHALPTERRITFADYSAEWLRLHAPSLKPRTVESYEMVLRVHLLPYFGHRLLSTIAQVHVEDFRARKAEEGGLSPTTINYTISILKMVLGKAQRLGYIPSNPAQHVAKLPKGTNDEDVMTWLTPGEVRAMLAAAGPDLRPLLLTMIMTGVRRGEALALRFGDVDFAAGLLHVRRGLVRVKMPEGGYRLAISQPKGKRSRRVDMSPEVADALRGLPSRFRGEDALVFCGKEGQPRDPDNLKRDFARVLRRAGVRKVRLHDLRHTFASIHLGAGASVKWVQAQLGHASPVTTLTQYAHLIPDLHQGEAARLGRLLFGEPTSQSAVTDLSPKQAQTA